MIRKFQKLTGTQQATPEMAGTRFAIETRLEGVESTPLYSENPCNTAVSIDNRLAAMNLQLQTTTQANDTQVEV